MRNFSLASITGIFVLFTCYSLLSQSSGITTSFFNSNLVYSILNQPGCTGIRVYPAIDPYSNLAVAMIVGIDKSGNEMYNPNQSSSKYQIFNGASEPVLSREIDKQNASSACNLYYSKYSSFVTDFDRSMVEECVGRGSGGLAVQYVSGRNGNFAISSFSNEGGAQPSGAYKAGNPCPSDCGSPSQYLVFPR